MQSRCNKTTREFLSAPKVAISAVKYNKLPVGAGLSLQQFDETSQAILWIFLVAVLVAVGWSICGETGHSQSS